MMETMTWRCFHCNEIFTYHEDAELHFGKFEDCIPLCKISGEHYRKMEAELNRWRSEDDNGSRVFYELGARHAGELRREEEKGYERGLRDAKFTELREFAELQRTLTARIMNALLDSKTRDNLLLADEVHRADAKAREALKRT